MSADDVAWITRDDIVEIDRVMVDDLGIHLIQMMENAGRNLARVVLDVLAPTTVSMVAGSGGNGGGGLVAARHLFNAGVDVTVCTSRPPTELEGVTAHQYRILDRLGVRTSDAPSPADACIDALIGYTLNGAPSGRAADLIGHMNQHDRVVALDTPSGLDVTSGTAPGAVVAADLTMTLALPKVGLRHAPQVGALFLADISVPARVAAEFGSAPPDWRLSPIVGLVHRGGAAASSR